MASEDVSDRLRVFIRLRPLPAPETPNHQLILMQGQLLVLRDPSAWTSFSSSPPPAIARTTEFIFDHVLDMARSQDEVFRMVCRPALDQVMAGKNACCFAFGASGTGKSYSIFGDERGRWEGRGFAPRSAEALLSEAHRLRSTSRKRLSLFLSLVEIRGEQIVDLGERANQGKSHNAMPPRPMTALPRGSAAAASAEAKTAPRVPPPIATSAWGVTPEEGGGSGSFEKEKRISPEPGEDVWGLLRNVTRHPVTTNDEAVSFISAAAALRQRQNGRFLPPASARSHFVFSMTVMQSDGGDTEAEPIWSELHLVDLADSEIARKSSAKDLADKEKQLTKKSFSALAKALIGVATGHLPPPSLWQSCALTAALHSSLGRDAHVTLMANVLPLPERYEECLGTLQYAHRCRHLERQPKINYVMGDEESQHQVILRLTKEVATLQADLQATTERHQCQLASLAALDASSISNQSSRSDVGSSFSHASGPFSGPANGWRGSILSKSRPGSLMQIATALQAKRPPGSSIVAVEGNVLAEEVMSKMKAKLCRREEEMAEMHSQAMQDQAKHHRELQAYRAKILILNKKAEEEKNSAVMKLQKSLEERDTRIKALLDQNEELAEKVTLLMKSTMRLQQQASDESATAAAVEDRIAREVAEEVKERMKTLEEQKEVDMVKVREERDSFACRSQEEVKRSMRECLDLRTAWEADSAAAQEELDALYEYVRKLTTLIMKAERGDCELRRLGMKPFAVPRRGCEGGRGGEGESGRDWRTQYVRRKIGFLDRFLERAEAKRPARGAPNPVTSSSSSLLKRPLTLRNGGGPMLFHSTSAPPLTSTMCRIGDEDVFDSTTARRPCTADSTLTRGSAQALGKALGKRGTCEGETLSALPF